MKMTPKHKHKEKTSTLLAAIVNSSDDAIISNDINGIVTTWNKAAEKLYGYKSTEIIGRPIFLILPQSNIEVLSKGKIRGKTKAMTKDGKVMYVLLVTTPLKDQNGDVIGVSIITRQMQQKNQVEKSKDNFINIASHELKTPITSIKAYAQILERKFTKSGDVESARYISRMHNQINKLTYLIRDLVDINKIKTRELFIRREEFNLEELIDELVEEIKLLAADIKITKRGSITKKVKGDSVQIGQVIINLITNAIRFASESNEFIIHLKQTKKNAIVGIQDFGIGIEAKHQKKIFERFYRINREHNAELPGLGVGLYISSEIIRSHQGKMWVKSNKNEGSIFYFALPICYKKDGKEIGNSRLEESGNI